MKVMGTYFEQEKEEPREIEFDQFSTLNNADRMIKFAESVAISRQYQQVSDNLDRLMEYDYYSEGIGSFFGSIIEGIKKLVGFISDMIGNLIDMIFGKSSGGGGGGGGIGSSTTVVNNISKSKKGLSKKLENSISTLSSEIKNNYDKIEQKAKHIIDTVVDELKQGVENDEYSKEEILNGIKKLEENTFDCEHVSQFSQKVSKVFNTDDISTKMGTIKELGDGVNKKLEDIDVDPDINALQSLHQWIKEDFWEDKYVEQVAEKILTDKQFKDHHYLLINDEYRVLCLTKDVSSIGLTANPDETGGLLTKFSGFTKGVQKIYDGLENDKNYGYENIKDNISKNMGDKSEPVLDNSYDTIKNSLNTFKSTETIPKEMIGSEIKKSYIDGGNNVLKIVSNVDNYVNYINNTKLKSILKILNDEDVTSEYTQGESILETDITEDLTNKIYAAFNPNIYNSWEVISKELTEYKKGLENFNANVMKTLDDGIPVEDDEGNELKDSKLREKYNEFIKMYKEYLNLVLSYINYIFSLNNISLHQINVGIASLLYMRELKYLIMDTTNLGFLKILKEELKKEI